MEDERNLEKSLALFAEAGDCIFSLVQLYDEGSGEHVTGKYPRFIQSGKGAHIWDLDGNEYIDFDMGLGPIILGYCYEAVDKAVTGQLAQGMHFSLVSPQEVEYARMLQKHIPCADKVRFFKTGSSACEAAIRTARAYTGKKHVIRGAFHGWHEWTIAAEGVRQGGILPEVRQYIHRCAYNALEQFEEVFAKYPGQVAAVIIEPMIIEEPKDNFLTNLQDLCRHNGAVLIFDEVVTGFRFGSGGAQRLLGVTPDLAVFGKGAANGLPLSFICGKKEILDEVDKEVYFFTTFGSERLSLAAGMAVLRELENKNVTEKIWAIGSELKTNVNEMARRLGTRIALLGPAPRLVFTFWDRQGRFDLQLKNIFMQECIKRGVFLGWTVFPCFSHTQEDIATALTVFEEALKICQKYQNAGDSAAAAWLSWGRKQ
ncbi:MAG: glutamate-1-semialdehyde 2,1-aminomutase [Desulfosporosinus sp. BRH_c37]|nr:MAG: glutamate-1-semialdehyde 2,1-aminomutase [Desulfosporosinus sp. BRH_c37]